MICERCQKNPATVHLTAIEKGVKKEGHLCDECARSAGVGMKVTFSISDILGNLVGPKAGKAGGKRVRQKICPECGLNSARFKSKARLGCAHDYEVFEAEIVPILEKVHGATRHLGKVPTTVEETVRRENELNLLKRELDSVVKSEDYERAAKIRDRIKHLEIEPDGDGA
jgi:protein arginine kinase activator